MFALLVSTLLAADPVEQEFRTKADGIKPTAAERLYLDIPWVNDLDDALRQAKQTQRPLFFWAAGGRDRDGIPLERC